MDIIEEKKALRRIALARRDALPAQERAEGSLALCRALEELEELREARIVLGFLPIGSECDLGALYDALRARDVVLAFPVADRGGRMEAYVPCGELVTGRFGIPQPDPACSRLLAPEALDAVLIPCVGFDGRLARLGYGGGYYDRFLRRSPRAAAILTAFEAQRLEHIPCEEHDLVFSILATERGILRL